MFGIKNRIIISFIIIILLGTVAGVSYYTYKQYLNIKQHKSISSVLHFMVKLETCVEHERILGTEYFVQHTKKTKTLLQQKREETDNQLIDVRKIIEPYKTNVELHYALSNFKESLGTMRKFIDNAQNRDNSVFFIKNDEVSATLLDFVTAYIQLSHDNEVSRYEDIYLDYFKLRENSVLEGTFIYYFLLQHHPMNKKEVAKWQRFIDNDTLPVLAIEKEDSLFTLLNTLNEHQDYMSFMHYERDILHSQIGSGAYTIQKVFWLNLMQKKREYFQKVSSLVIHKIDEVNASQLSVPRNFLILGLFIGLGLFYLIFRFMWLFIQLSKNKKVTLETVKDIELVFNPFQQQEIKRLLAEGKVEKLYRFLIQAIKDANQTKDLFLASMSHEIRTPLNGILGFTQLLKETEEQDEREEFISIIEKSSENLLTIVNDILDLSKIKAEKVEIENIEFDPIDNFEAAVESYAAKAAEEQIDFTIFVDPLLPTVLVGDPTKISQVIVNLISNAIKFTPRNGTVSVRIEKCNDEQNSVTVKFSVSDTGIGMTEEQQKKIFQAFTQADVSTSRKYGGTGLGLSISGKFIELMGSELKVQSIKDEGSTFYFTLTLAKPHTAKKREIPVLNMNRVGILNSHIDDNYHINENLEAYIRYLGVDVVHYTEDSLMVLKESPHKLPDILFIDHMLRWRSDDLEPFLNFSTKIVLMTTGDQKRNIKRYKQKIDKILYKPITLSKTIRMLKDTKDISFIGNKIIFENIHILVADDNMINQKLIKNILDRLGIDVSIASNGEEALLLRAKHTYDMILMDIEMPIMGGMEATAKILSYERSQNLRHVPIVALTANVLAGDREKYLGAGMDSYLSKPIELEALKELLMYYFEDKIIENESGT